MRLKVLNYILATGFISTLIIAAASLVFLSDRLRTAAELVGDSVESVHASEELQVRLLSHNRETFLLSLDPQGSPARITRLLEEKKQIWHWLDEIGNYVDTPEEQLLVEEVRKSVNQYMEERQRIAQSDITPEQAYLEVSPKLREAYRLARDLTEMNMQQARDFQSHAAQQNQVANFIGLFIALFCIVTLPLSLVLMHRWVYQPIQSIHSMIVRAKDGDRTVQAPEAGVQELQQIGASFNDLLERLDQQRTRQLHFLAGVAHDLRNPLGAIRSSAELLSAKNLSKEDRLPILDIISRQSLHLERMVGDFLDSSRIESGQLELKKEETTLASILRESVQLHQQTTGIHTLLLEAEEVICPCDPVRIGQVLNNLLNNAIKYSPNGGFIQVQLKQQGDYAVLSISDEGLGIPEQDINRIFEPFRRSSHSKNIVPGIGIGLSVSKRIVEAHGGKIEVESKIDIGTTFKVYLPCFETHSQKEPTPPSAVELTH